MENAQKFIGCFLMFPFLLVGCGGGSSNVDKRATPNENGGSESSSQDPNTSIALDPTSIPGAYTYNTIEDLRTQTAKFLEDRKSSWDQLPGEDSAVLNTLWDLQDEAFAQLEDIIRKVQKGEKVELSLKTKSETILEKVVVSQESLLLLDQLLQEETNSKSIGVQTITARSCPVDKEMLTITDNIGRTTAMACGFSTIAATGAGFTVVPLDAVATQACAAHAATMIIDKALIVGDILCQMDPHYLEKIEIYPERPCLKANPNSQATEDHMNVIVEATFINKIEPGSTLQRLVSAVVDDVIKTYTAGMDNEIKLLTFYKDFFEEQIANRIRDSFQKIGIDIDQPRNTQRILKTMDNSDVQEWITWHMSDPLYIDDDQTLASDNRSGVGTLQATITGWPTDPERIFQSSVREVRVSTPPVLVSFDMPDAIFGSGDPIGGDWTEEQVAIGNDWLNHAAATLSNGSITIRDDEEDLLWVYFAEGNDVGVQRFIYGVQTAPTVSVSYEASEELYSLIPGPGSKTVFLRARDLCGNDVILKRHTFSWEACPVEVCIPRELEVQKIYGFYDVTSGLEQTHGQPNFEKAIDDLGMVGGSGSTSWSNIMRADGKLSFGGRPWIEILKEHDAIQ